MFARSKLIKEKHKVALQAVLGGSHRMVTEALLIHLYELACAGTKADDKTLFSELKTETLLVRTATDIKSGVYVQLGGDLEWKDTFLTIGTKWAVEQKDTRGTTNTILW